MVKEVSAGIVPVRWDGKQYLFLMMRSFKHFWDFPKGHVEDGETELEAALRETKEESTITKKELNFRWGTNSYATEPFKKGSKIAVYFVAETTRKEISLPVNPSLGIPEHDGYEWMTYAKAKTVVNERIGKVLEWAHNEIQTF